MPWDDEIDVASVLAPVDITNTAGVLTSVTAGGVALAEDTNAAWSSATTYSIGQRVSSASTHRVYESLKDSNTNHDPTVVANRVSAAGVGTWWFDVGPTNKYAMFDGLVSSQTSATSPLVITLTPGAFNGFALLGVDADTLAVTVKDAPGGTTIWSLPSMPMEGSQPADFYEYFFDRFRPLTRYVATGIEPYSASELVITLTKATGPVKLGMVAVGDMRPIGIPQRDASVEPIDYSRVKTDAYGNSEVKKGLFATGMSITTKMDKEDAGVVLDTIQQILGTPVLLVGSQAKFYEWMTTFGLISGRMSPAEFPLATLSITLKGLI